MSFELVPLTISCCNELLSLFIEKFRILSYCFIYNYQLSEIFIHLEIDFFLTFHFSDCHNLQELFELFGTLLKNQSILQLFTELNAYLKMVDEVPL